MSNSRIHPAYSLEIVVSNTQFKKTGQIIAAIPGHVDVRAAGPQTSGWIRLVLTTDGEENLHALEAQLRKGLDYHLVYCEDRVFGAQPRRQNPDPCECSTQDR